MPNNRPRGREKNVTGQGKDVYKHGSGLGTGPVGGKTGSANSSGSTPRPGGSFRPGTTGRPAGSAPVSPVSGQSMTRAGGGKGKLILIVLVIAAVILFGGKLLGGGGTQEAAKPSAYTQSSFGGLSSLLNGFSGGFPASSVSTGWTHTANTGKLDTSVASGARDKYTTILGNQQDTVTIMVYMCGTDLESKGGMATSDLQEMASASLSDNINLLVYTGGCKSWRNDIVSSKVNQIYKVEGGGLRCLEADMGSGAMTDPANLTMFIQWCAKNFPANRNELIFWDHGGGSISGYGYDEKNSRSGSMNLTGINKALHDAKMKFDFIGFDACLMATAENALMLTDYADYLIASEETEPGVGWYYTNWLTAFSKDPSMDTVKVGQKIVDDFVDVCAQKCRGQDTTLSVIDLAELEVTLPDVLRDFAVSTSKLIENDSYKTVSDARSSAREFSPSSKIDQIDLIDLAYGMNTKEGDNLAEALLSAVKYNRTSSGMTNAYGISIFFPYKKTANVSNAVKCYDALGMDSEYGECIQKFVSMQAAGQYVSSNQSSGSVGTPYSSLFGSLSGSGSISNTAVPSSGSSYASGSLTSDLVSQLLGSLLSSSSSGSSMFGMLDFFGRSIDMDSAAVYLTENAFDAGQLVWTKNAEGTTVLSLSEEQWNLVHDLELNVFYDDGEGYIDLGMDNVFSFDDDGALIGEFDPTWIAINDQPVPYYYLGMVDDGEDYTITGRVPVLLNGDRADLILVFENGKGYVAGARYDYRDGETETIAKSCSELTEGDTIQFVCDYYTYDGEYQDSYLYGDAITVNGELTVSDVYLPHPENARATYRFTDLYNQEYWTPTLP